MPGGIYLIQDGGGLVRMDEQAYDSEALLHMLIAQYPDLLAGEQAEGVEPRRYLLVEREAAIPVAEGGADHFALDHLFLDQDGVPTLVEVKRSSDTRIRREVVGQMLDYAANAVAYWPAGRLQEAFEARCRQEGEEPEDALAGALGSDVEYGEFWQRVKTNLLAKRIRLVFVADHIPPELRRIVEFLNETMDPVEVLAVEVPQYVGGAHKALVPRVIGQTARAQQKKGTASLPKTNRETFLATWDEPARGVYERLLDFAEAQGLFVRWGTRGFSMNVPLEGKYVSILEGYPPANFDGIYIMLNAIRKKVKDPDPVVDWYREQVAMRAGATPTPTAMRCPADLDVEAERALHDVLLGVIERTKAHGLAE